MREIIKYELKKFGVPEVFYHTRYSLFHDEKALNKMLIIRDCYYNNLNEEQMAQAILELYSAETGDIFDIHNPKSFNEYIQWLKIYDNIPEKTTLSDKYLVRDWVKDKIGEKYLVKILGVWDSIDQVNFDKLPLSFCLKMNHGCAMNYPVCDKNNVSLDDIKNTFYLWEKRPFYAYSLEPQYKDIPRKVIAEEYIKQFDGNLVDYKIHCFNGVPKIIQVIGNRNLKEHKGQEAFFDTKWTSNNLMYNTYDQYSVEPCAPSNLSEMLDVASTLSEGFIYVRVDLYNIDGEIKFGEMTFTPASGFGKWASEEKNIEVGKMFNIV